MCELEDGREVTEGAFLEDMESDRAWRQEWAVRAFQWGKLPMFDVEGSMSILLGQREGSLEGRGYRDKTDGRLFGSSSWPVGGA